MVFAAADGGPSVPHAGAGEDAGHPGPALDGRRLVLAVIEHGIDYNFYDTFTAARADIQVLLTQATESHRAGDVTARRVRVAFNHPIELGLHLMCMLILSRSRSDSAARSARSGLLGGAAALLAGPPLYLQPWTHAGPACGLVWLALIGRGSRSLLPAMIICGLVAYVVMPGSAREVLDRTIATSTDIQTGDSIGGGTVRARLNLLEAGLKDLAAEPLVRTRPG